MAALLIAGGALWVELMPDPVTEHPFATISITTGETIDESNTELRTIEAGLLDPVSLGEVASRQILAGEPVLESMVRGHGRVIPPGWWVVEMPTPRSAAPGERVQLVLLDSGSVVPGVVASPASTDPLGDDLGGVAVESGHAADVAAAAALGRIAVMIATS